jgi:hypothetical protein
LLGSRSILKRASNNAHCGLPFADVGCPVPASYLHRRE